jgi:methylation protein MtfA
MSTVDLVDGGEESSDLEVEAVGASGRRYRMFEHWPAGAPTRAVTIVPDDADVDAPLTVCTTTIGVLPAEQLERELAAAGLIVRERVPLASASGLRHRDVLLELEAAA